VGSAAAAQMRATSTRKTGGGDIALTHSRRTGGYVGIFARGVEANAADGTLTEHFRFRWGTRF
jgi:hypothetical protein